MDQRYRYIYAEQIVTDMGTSYRSCPQVVTADPTKIKSSRLQIHIDHHQAFLTATITEKFQINHKQALVTYPLQSPV